MCGALWRWSAMPGWATALEAIVDNAMSATDDTVVMTLHVLSSLCSGFGVAGARLAESEAGLAIKHAVAEAGALELAATVLSTTAHGKDHSADDDYSAARVSEGYTKVQVQHVNALNMVTTVCFGHDGRDGHGDPEVGERERERGPPPPPFLGCV